MLLEYIAGPTLEVLRRNQPERRFPWPKALLLMTPIVEALIYLHHQDPPIVHRDIKPANIIVPAGREGAFLVDFGIAKEYVENGTTNVTRAFTPGYAALEQYSGGTTPRTDVYGLGATFYTLLTGKIPLDAIQRTLGSEGADPLLPVGLIVPEIPRGVEKAIERAMALEREARFETIEQFWQEVRRNASPQQEHRALPVAPALSPPLSQHRREPRRRAPSRREPHGPAQRKRWVIILLAVILLFTVVGGVGLLLSSRTNRSAPAAPASGPASSPTPLPELGKTCAVSPSSTSPQEPPLSPKLSPCYAGTIADLMTNQTTAMYLLDIQQSQGNIHGTFQGLGLVGTFEGTVTSDEQLHFTLPVHAGEQTLAFVGTIKIGGDIKGSFRVLDQQEHFTGEFGDWYVGAYA
jgi:serine/threonine protein kinase